MFVALLGLAWDLVVVLALVLVAVLFVAFRARSNPQVFALANKLPLPPGWTGGAAGSFIGRTKELETFRELIHDPAAADRLPALLLVSGPPGIGKNALLERFASICAERKVPRCGPVVSLSQRRAMPELLREIAQRFEQQQKGSFSEFAKAFDRHRRVSQGQRTRGQEGLDAVRDIVSVGTGLVPAADRVAAALGTGSAENALEAWEGGSSISDVGDAFASDLVKLADEDPRKRLVLFFSDLDSRPNDREIIWLRSWLLPLVALRPSILIVASVTTDDLEDPGLAGLDRLGDPARMPLSPLTDAEARRFVADAIGLDEDSPLSEIIVARSGGNLEHLQGYRRLIERDPELRKAESLPPDADSWASGGPAYSLLRDLPSRFLETVVVASSPLRWFNSNLLEDVAKEAAAEPEPEDKEHSASDLIRWGTRPAWIRSRGAGWGVDDPEHRRALVAELRRLDPSLFHKVHELGARYHRDRLHELADQPVADQSDLYSAPETPPDGFKDSRYTTTVAEWLYHLLAIAPDRAFPLAVRKGVEALFTDEEAAEHILPTDLELDLRPSDRVYLDLLARAATALKDARLTDAVRFLDQLTKAGEPVALVKPVVLHRLGEAYSRLDVDKAARCFERSHELLGKPRLVNDGVAIRMRCYNAMSLAYALVSRDGGERAALERLDEAAALAENTGSAELVGELARVKGVIQQVVANVIDAEQSFDTARERFEAAGLPDAVASVRWDLAILFLEAGDYDRAASEFEIAEVLYSFLPDFKNRAMIHAARVELDLLTGDCESADRHVTEARRLRPGDAELENFLGNSHFSAGDVARAIPFYRQAIERAPDLAVYRRNLAGALFQKHENGEAEAADLPEAEELLDALYDETPDELTLLLYARVKRAQGGREAAQRAINTLKNRRLRQVRRHPKRAGVHWSLGILLWNWGQVLGEAEGRQAYVEAEQAFATAAELEPDEPSYGFLRGRCLLELGRGEEAVRLLQAAAISAPGRHVVRQQLASAIGTLPSAQQKLMELRWGLERFPGDSSLLEAYADALDELDATEALLEVEHELHSAPDEAEFHFLRARVLKMQVRVAEPGGDRFEQPVPPASSLAETVHGSPRARGAGRSNGREILDEFALACSLSEREQAGSKESRCKYLVHLAEHEIECREWSNAKAVALEARELVPDSWRVGEVLKRARYGSSWVRMVEAPDPYVRPVEVEVSEDLLPWVQPPGAQYLYDNMLPEMRQRLAERWGVMFPGIRVRPDDDLPASTVTVHLREVPTYRFTARPGYLAAVSRERLTELGVDATAATRPWDGGPASWIAQDALPAVRHQEIPFWDPSGVIVSTVAAILEKHRGDIVRVNDVARLARVPENGSPPADDRLPELLAASRQMLAAGFSTTQLTDVAQQLGTTPRQLEPGQVAAAIRKRTRRRTPTAAG